MLSWIPRPGHRSPSASPLRSSACLILALAVFGAAGGAQAPVLDKAERDRAKQMLGDIEKAVRDNYYDRTYRGLDLKAHFGEARQKLDTAVSLGHAYAIIAQALVDFDDSHTFFIPPQNPNTYEYGWEMQIVGDQCYVVAVKPGSDAEAKGLRPGDRVLQVEAFSPTRKDLWKARYLYQLLSPRSTMTLVAQSPGGQPRKVPVAATVTPGKRVIEIGIENILEDGRLPVEEPLVRRHRWARVGDVAVWKLATFDFDSGDVDRLVDQVVKGASGLVVDLRGNAGGSVKTLEQVTRRFFDRDVKIADVKGRRSSRALVAKKRGSPFTANIVVLIDAESGSAAEVLARVIQIEKRGVVLGDRSSGSVMQSRRTMAAVEIVDGFIPYGMSITDADIIMTDGQSLEHAGVTPDELLVPTPEDLAAGRDPVLVRAAAILGAALDPVAAGRMFPVEWKNK